MAMKRTKIFKPPEGEEDKHAYHSPLEQKVSEVLSPFEQFKKSQILASSLLMLCALVAILWASLPMAKYSYQWFTHLQFGFHIAGNTIAQPVEFWVNDILLTLFFFLIGLEIKREVLVGELANKKTAVLVTLAAIGGMVFPAGLYMLINIGSPETIHAWGIPMATDTAFALAMLSLFKNKLPTNVFTFMAALAIIDDIGAILVIAIFYSDNIVIAPLILAACLLLCLVLFNYSGVRNPIPYLGLGILILILVESAGIHSTIAGIAVAFTIPARPQKGPRHFLNRTKSLLQYFEHRKDKAQLLADKKQHEILEELKENLVHATTPLQRWESNLELPILLIILPLFALVNAGLPIQTFANYEAFFQPLTIGIIIGLVIGKPLGITLFSWVALKLKQGTLPEGIKLKHVMAISLFAGIGFTMSLFVSSLAFEPNSANALIAKGSIFIGSILAGVIGCLALVLFKRSQTTV